MAAADPAPTACTRLSQSGPASSADNWTDCVTPDHDIVCCILIVSSMTENFAGEAPDPVGQQAGVQGNMGLCGPDGQEGGSPGSLQR